MSWWRFLFRIVLGRRLPVTSGTLTVPGLRDAVRIDRDRWGIPHIEAANDGDAWFGLGFCHGQDRTFQLEGILRASRGTLAELIGAKGLAVDRLSRRVGFHRSARRHLAALAADARAIIEAFAAGVSQGASVGLTRKPHEFAIFGGTPTPWTAVDVLAFVKLQSFTLPSNWDSELSRLQVLLNDGPEALLALDPSARPDYPVRGMTNLDSLASDVAAFRAAMPAAGGSNNWVIAGAHTATGRPIVANDPHLFPALPPPWYVAHIRTPEWTIAGATFAGSPAFAAGFNGHVAWGVTAGLVDNADLFLERIGPDGRSVKQGDRFVPCETHEEIIRVKGMSPVTEVVLETPRGPIISPALIDEFPALSLRAVWLEPRPVRGFLFAPRCRTGQELRFLFAEWPILPLNLVLADVNDQVGWQLVGQAPRRKKGNGTLPMPGWDDEYGWHDDLVPFEQMPRVDNPGTGLFATANNAPPGNEDGPFLGVEWLDPYRRDAIVQELSSRNGWTVADCQALQRNWLSLPWQEMRNDVIDIARGDARLKEASDLLAAWDGALAPDSRAAALFQVFVTGMIVRVTKAKAPKSAEWLLGQAACTPGINLFYLRRTKHLAVLIRTKPSGWFPHSWEEEILAALLQSQEQVGARTWGDLHPLRPKHLLFGDIWPFKHIFSCGPIPWGGDADAISQGAVRPLNPTGETDNVATMRMVADVGNWSASRFGLAGGQSGNPMSPHYADLFEIWPSGGGVPMAWSVEEVQKAACETLTLKPSLP